MGYSPWGHKELDMTERLTLSLLVLETATVLGSWPHPHFISKAISGVTSSLALPSTPTSMPSYHCCLFLLILPPPLRTLVMTFKAHPDHNPGDSPHLKILN